MPLTLAHPAAVIPLARPLGRRASVSALVIGSMAPDFAYVLPLGLARMQTHDIWALLWFCLPVGLLVYYLFHLLLGPIAARLFPEGIAARLPASAFCGKIPGTRLPVVMSSLLLGAASHLVVDSITHRDGLVVQLLPILQTYVGSIGGYRVYVFRILQYVFSAIGVALIWGWVRGWLRRTPPAPIHARLSIAPRLRFACLCLLIALPIATGALAALRPHSPRHRTTILREQTRNFLKGGGTMLWVNWIALGLVLRIRRPSQNPSSDDPGSRA